MSELIARKPYTYYLDQSKQWMVQNIRILFFLTGIILSLVIFEEVYDDIFDDIPKGDLDAQIFDQNVRAYIASIQNTFTSEIMRDITSLGSVTVMSIFFLIIAAALRNLRQYKTLLYQFVVFIGAGGLPFILKMIFNRPRPESEAWLTEVYTSSFPSGHSFAAASVYLSFAFIFTRFAKSWRQEVFYYLVSFLIIFAVGFSRVYLQVHYTTDVIAGISLGLSWTLFLSLIYELSNRKVVSKP